jgi:hypothetical protein
MTTVYYTVPLQFGAFEPIEVPVSWAPTPGVYSPPTHVPGVVYASVSTAGHTEHSLRFAIGKEGCAWKAISHQTGALYIWNNKEEGYIEVWGYPENAAAAASRVQDRLALVLEQQFPKMA